MKEIVIQEIPLDEIVEYDKARFNSNNHWENDIRPDDYLERLTICNTNHWVDKFRSEYKVINIDDPSEIAWMKVATEVGSQTGRFSHLYREELDDFVKKYEPIYADIFNGQRYFVRTENVSLKYGHHGAGPYRNLREIIESLTSCIQGHRPLTPETQSVTLYLFPWLETLSGSYEFRVFVHNKRITAISQQLLYKAYDHMKENASRIVQKVLEYFEEVIKERIDQDSYTYDFALLSGEIPYFIEVNCFGKEYAAGSSLFHWLLDESILYSDGEVVHFRYTVK